MFKGAMRLDEFCKQQEELGRKVVHTHEEVEELSYAVVELTCSSRQEAMLLAQKISSDAGTDDLRERYGPICEIAYYEGNE